MRPATPRAGDPSARPPARAVHAAADALLDVVRLAPPWPAAPAGAPRHLLVVVRLRPPARVEEAVALDGPPCPAGLAAALRSLRPLPNRVDLGPGAAPLGLALAVLVVKEGVEVRWGEVGAPPATARRILY